MKEALQNGTLDLPRKFKGARQRLKDTISRADSTPLIQDASRDVLVKLNKAAILSSKLTEL